MGLVARGCHYEDPDSQRLGDQICAPLTSTINLRLLTQTLPHTLQPTRTHEYTRHKPARVRPLGTEYNHNGTPSSGPEYVFLFRAQLNLHPKNNQRSIWVHFDQPFRIQVLQCDDASCSIQHLVQRRWLIELLLANTIVAWASIQSMS
jgi:hypothetical protein